MTLCVSALPCSILGEGREEGGAGGQRGNDVEGRWEEGGEERSGRGEKKREEEENRMEE